MVDVNNDMSKVGIKVPESATWGAEIPAGYKWVEAAEVGYCTVTQSATYGKYEVRVDSTKDLKEEVVLPEEVQVGKETTISQAEEVLKAATTTATAADRGLGAIPALGV